MVNVNSSSSSQIMHYIFIIFSKEIEEAKKGGAMKKNKYGLGQIKAELY